MATSPTLPASRTGEVSLLEPGTLVGGHAVRGVIGQGGCGTVYVAEHGGTGEEIAIKVLHAALAVSQQQVRRFLQEAQAVQRIRHAGIVDIHDSGHLGDGRPYLVMELIRGRNLSVFLHEHGRLSLREVLSLLEPLCDALAHAHDAGIVHRDIKASNIMVTGDLDDRGIKLLDFGIAKLADDESSDGPHTSIGRVLGTPYCMAPEQIRGRSVDARTDTYALGTLVYRMLTGRYPFCSGDAQFIAQMHLKAPPPRPGALAPVPPAIDELVQKAMAKEPAQRFDGPRSLVAALRGIVRAEEAVSEPDVPALALYVHGYMEARDADDRVLDELMATLDQAEAFLRARGLQIALQTGDAVLGVALAGEHRDAMRARVLDTALALRGAISRRQSADSGLHINVCVHDDRAVVRREGEGARVIGGGILDVGAWAPLAPMTGVVATRETLPTHTAADGARYVRVHDSDGASGGAARQEAG